MSFGTGKASFLLGSLHHHRQEGICITWRRTSLIPRNYFLQSRVQATPGDHDAWWPLLYLHELKYEALIEIVVKVNSRLFFGVVGGAFER